MGLLLGLGILIVGTLLGIILGKCFAKLYQSILNKKDIANAKKVMSGEKENKCEIDGQVIKANKFRIRNEEQKDEVITFGKGGVVRKVVEIRKEKQPIIKEKPKKKPARIKRSKSFKKGNKKK